MNWTLANIWAADMVTLIVGDIFQSRAQTLLNAVNCVGVMGKGIAQQFKSRFAEMFADYAKRCNAGQVQTGRPYLFRRDMPPWILNFPTKDHWRTVSRLEDIIHGLEYLERHYAEWGIESLAVPALGCGEGHLEWEVIRPALCGYLERLQIPVELYAPFNSPHEESRPTGYTARWS